MQKLHLKISKLNLYSYQDIEGKWVKPKSYDFFRSISQGKIKVKINK